MPNPKHSSHPKSTAPDSNLPKRFRVLGQGVAHSLSQACDCGVFGLLMLFAVQYVGDRNNNQLVLVATTTISKACSTGSRLLNLPQRLWPQRQPGPLQVLKFRRGSGLIVRVLRLYESCIHVQTISLSAVLQSSFFDDSRADVHQVKLRSSSTRPGRLVGQSTA